MEELRKRGIGLIFVLIGFFYWGWEVDFRELEGSREICVVVYGEGIVEI